ncbi:hypothetical protein EMCRGX_G020363 [Ephydatia muelleri]|eukprot:Em0016g284a
MNVRGLYVKFLGHKLLLGLLAGISVAILAGYLLNRRRRKYRAIAHPPENKTPAVVVVDTSDGRYRPYSRRRRLQDSDDSEHSAVDEEIQSRASESDREYHEPLELSEVNSNADELFTSLPEGDFSSLGSGYESDNSSVSFHSTVESHFASIERSPSNPLALYSQGMDMVNRGLVKCRTDRTAMLACSSELDFLAKVFSVRLAFDELVKSEANRNHFRQAGRDMMVSFLRSANQDPGQFCERYDDVFNHLQDEDNWSQAGVELAGRRVVCMNVYDIALDFVLMDAFTDLANPPSTIVAALQNRWLTERMKEAALYTALWSVLRAKRGMLQNKNGFLGKFYLLSETMTPLLAWGFLGTNTALKNKCEHFKGVIMEFLQTIFSLNSVHYSTPQELAEDIVSQSRHVTKRLSV